MDEMSTLVFDSTGIAMVFLANVSLFNYGRTSLESLENLTLRITVENVYKILFKTLKKWANPDCLGQSPTKYKAVICAKVSVSIKD